MEALISGQAQVAILVQGDTASVSRWDRPEETFECSLTAVPILLGGASDVVHYPSISEQDAQVKLRLAVNCDLALHQVLILLDCVEEGETREIAAQELDAALSDDGVYEFVADHLCSVPLPGGADISGVRKLAPAATSVWKLLDEVARIQPVLLRYHRAWEELPPSLFPDLEARNRVRALLISAGAFRVLANAGENPGSFDAARFACYQALAAEPCGREVLRAWLSGFAPKSPKSGVAVVPECVEAGERGQPPSTRTRPDHMTPHEVFESVVTQKQGIVQAMRRGRLTNARRYTRQLVDFQIGRGDTDFAAKSLCDLAQEAKRLSAHSFQLELATRAADIAPSDGWACGQVADAYCCLDQYDQAANWLDKAAAFGQAAFACTGHARILRRQGRLEEAARRLTEVCDLYPNEVHPWLGLAEVQRDLLRLDDALRTYEAAIARFPQERVPRCGRAAVLEDLGRFQDALAAYDQAIGQSPDDVVSRAGRAEVLSEMGRMEDAFAAYEETVKLFPEEPVPRCGRAEVLKEMGRFDDALRAYEDTIADLGHLSIPWNGHAEVYRQMGQLDEALRVYDEAARRFPEDVRTLGGRANVLKLQGKLEDALQAYDRIVASFPHDEFARRGRADLLKELRFLPQALDAYDQVIARNPHAHGALYAKAAVLVAMGRYTEAQALLPQAAPRTRDEWVAHHVRGMILLRSGRLDEADYLFRDALATIPFAKQRKYYEKALAISALRQHRLQEAAGYLVNDQEPPADVLRLHVFGEERRVLEARNAYTRLLGNCPRILVPVRDELAARYELIARGPEHDWSWIFQEECTCILLLAA
jgi:tetratricopeptide (TPR) repeat protein